MKEKVREVDFEVLPKGGARRTTGPQVDDPLIALLTRLMDTAFKIPGTNIRFGLDPLIGLLPVVGSSASSLVSLFLIARSARYGVPRAVLARMAFNVGINAVLDAVPVVGDALSVFYRSNAKNYELLRKYAGTGAGVAGPRRASNRDWLFVAALLGGLFLVLLFLIVGAATVIAKLWHAIF